MNLWKRFCRWNERRCYDQTNNHSLPEPVRKRYFRKAAAWERRGARK